MATPLEHAQRASRSARRYRSWAIGVVVAGVIGSFVIAVALTECRGIPGNCPDRVIVGFPIFIGSLAASLLPALPLFALSQVLEHLSVLLFEVRSPPVAPGALDRLLGRPNDSAAPQPD
jgi:hypothetical protein